jgi:hypothetical protein
MVDSVAPTIALVVTNGAGVVQPTGADAREITARFRGFGRRVCDESLVICWAL